MTIRLDVAELTLAELADLRDQLRAKPGERSVETKLAIKQRGSLIREFAARYYPNLTRNQQAEAIHAELRRYAGSTWLRTRADLECRHRDDRRRLIWEILKLRGGHVPAVRTINDILGRRG
ncbi:hypothetical protein [Bradyrhizobium sp. BR 1432]|uniref:hypothetical protein n=1 Tax=Bradyrhizobium sp. BR 1432 TaxID=3447966 RepID=UPI003EE706FD